MKVSEVLAQVMAGELLLVGEFRGGRASRRDYVDKKKGLMIPRVCITYTRGDSSRIHVPAPALP